MVDSAEFPYRLATGWITKAAIEASSAYLLQNFPTQTDQNAYVMPWLCLADDGTTYPAFTRYPQASDQSQQSDGPVTFVWSFAYLTEGMLSYLEGLLFGGVGMYPDASTQSAAITIKTRRANGEFMVVQGYANRGIPNQSYRRGNRGVEGYRLTVVQGTEITA